MYLESKIKGKQGLLWFDARTDWEKSSDEYFEDLDELAQWLDGLGYELDFDTSLDPVDFDSGYEYVYGRIKELKEYIDHNEAAEELDSVNVSGIMEDLRDVYEEYLHLYDSALLYDDYSGDESDDSEDDEDDEDWDSDNDWDEDDYSADDAL